MTKALSIAALLLLVLCPLQASAQPPLTLVQQQSAADDGNSVDPNHILAVGAGVIIGGVAAGATLNFMGSSLLGAIAGGLIANWWYTRSDEPLGLEPRR